MKRSIKSNFSMFLIVFSLIWKLKKSFWISKDVVLLINASFWNEEQSSEMSKEETHRAPIYPFISGSGFRHNSSYRCDQFNDCKISAHMIKPGACIYIKTDYFEMFMNNIAIKIPGPYKIINHDSDYSAPDGANTHYVMNEREYTTSKILLSEYRSNRLIAHFGLNLWWIHNEQIGRPEYSHCIPIGIPNRDHLRRYMSTGPTIYLQAMERNILNSPTPTLEHLNTLPLLLVSFTHHRIKPDRGFALSQLKKTENDLDPSTGLPFGRWYHQVDSDHIGWLNSIGKHKFVLAPFGHGYDTFRLTEILMMGGVPVIVKSTIASCYDDTDNIYNEYNPLTKTHRTHTRGRIPIVILNSWADLNKSRLENEWTDLSKIVLTYPWDWKRVFIYQWLERIGC